MKKNKQSFMQGVMILMMSQLIIKIAGLIYKIYLTNKEGFGDTGNAIYSAGFQMYSLFLAISSIGVPNAISQLISSKVAVGDNRGAYRIFKIAISIFGLIGFIGSTILFLYSKQIAVSYLGIPETELVIMSLAPSVFVVAVSSVLRGYFNGIEKISVTAHSQSIEQILKTIGTIIIVEIIAYISKDDTIVMVASAATISTLATFFSFGYLYYAYIRNKRSIWKDVITSTVQEKESITKIIKSILYLSLPMAFTALLSATNRTVDAFSIVNIISKFMTVEEATMQYGILTGKIESLVVLPYSFNIAFSISLIPVISASKARGELDQATKRISFSILATILIALPCTAIFYFFSDQILKLLFPNAYLGGKMLKLASLSIIFVTVAQTIGGVMQGLKKVKEPAIAIGLGALVKTILNFILLPIESINIYGAIIATLVGHITTFIISIYYLKKYIDIDLNITKFIIKPTIASIVMITCARFSYINIKISHMANINLIFSLFVGIITYIIAIICLKILSKEDVNMLPYLNKVIKIRDKKCLK